MSANNTKFINPYDLEHDPSTNAPPDEKRVHTEVSRSDYLLIKLIRPDQGTIKNVLGLLWKQLCHELRERQFTDTTSCTEFESFLSNCRIVPSDEYDNLLANASQWEQHQCAKGVLSDSATHSNSGRSTKTNRGNVRARASRLPASSPNQPPKHSNLPGDSISGGGGSDNESKGKGE